MIVLRNNKEESSQSRLTRAAITGSAIGAGIGGLVGLRKGTERGLISGMITGAALGLGATPIIFGLSDKSKNNTPTPKVSHPKFWEELKKKWIILRKIESLSEAIGKVLPDWGDGDEYFYFYLANSFDLEEQIERGEEWIDLMRIPQKGYIQFNVKTGKFRSLFYKKEFNVSSLKAHLIQLAQDDIRGFEAVLKTDFDEYDQERFGEAIESEKKIIDLIKRML